MFVYKKNKKYAAKIQQKQNKNWVKNTQQKQRKSCGKFFGESFCQKFLKISFEISRGFLPWIIKRKSLIFKSIFAFKQ